MSNQGRQSSGFVFAFCGSALALLPVVHAATRPLPKTIDFNRDIRPIFSENCYFCHGPDKNKRKGDLRLDTHDGLFSTHDKAVTVIPGHPEQSELFKRIIETDPAERMPDPKSNKKLADRQIALIREWIKQGAPWEGFWAYLKPKRAEVPAIDDARFVRNPIDNFILAGLKDAGLHHAPEADRVTLIRRLSFDLTGLPPSESEVRKFADDNSPDAYERLVTRLISSPHYGERMAMYWLDMVRFADSIGYHSDNPMNVWPYRDYVIEAFNRDKPFHQFTREQLAGDLLPDANQGTRVASCYNRLIETTEEGGAQPKEYTIKYECDRVRNISTVWMAATMGCSQCHDHKFDPYTQKDFYGMAAFFADLKEAAVGRREPGMPVLDDAQSSRLKTLDDRIADLEHKLQVQTPELAAEQAQWEKQLQATAKVHWMVLNPSSAVSRKGTVLAIRPDGSILGSKFVSKDVFVVQATTDVSPITGIRLEALPDPSLPANGPGASSNGNFVLSGFKLSAQHGGDIKLARAAADYSQSTYPVSGLIQHDAKAGWAILPEVGKAHVAVFEPARPIDSDEANRLTVTLEFQSQFRDHELGRFRIAVTTDPAPAEELAVPAKIRQILSLEPGQRSADQNHELEEYYRTVSPTLAPIRTELAKVQKEKQEFLNDVPKCLVSVSGPPRVVRLLHRGDWMDDSGEIQSPSVPRFLPQPRWGSERLTRLDLANWLVSAENPLTARVFVNRLWKMFFGVGLSKTLDDLGSQGESPTNPELLDWLACEFMESGWDVKHMVRLIVTSGAYRQSSVATGEDNQIDPFDRLYAHQARFRLDAEMVRDNALSISGLLSPRIGGPSVKPYQPDGFWDPLNFPPRKYEADHGESQYRRGLYTWWQRTFPHPSLTAFDAPSREEATCERLRSNIPQQALVLLNDPTYVEAARVLAARIMKEGGSSFPERLTWAYQAALNRAPRSEEVEILSDLYQKHLDEYSKDKDAAAKVVSMGETSVPKDLDVPELAAWTSVSRVIINLSETITRS